MTNEEKAQELAIDDFLNRENINPVRYTAAMEMARWKDVQHEKEKQQLIDEAAEWFSYRFPNISKESFEKFKEDMKGE